MKKLSLRDSKSGEMLDIEFDLEKNMIRINGVIVVRGEEYESESDENTFIYVSTKSAPGKPEFYYLTRKQVEQMRKLWEE